MGLRSWLTKTSRAEFASLADTILVNMPPHLLDDFLCVCPAWHRGRGPAKYGNYLTERDLPISHKAKS